MHKVKPGLMRLRNYVLLSLGVAMILLVAGYLIVGNIEKYYYHRVEVEARRFAQSYANSLKTAIEASSIVNKLLAEKLLAAGEVAVSMEEHQSNEALAQLAKAMRVDEIYAYDAQGIVRFSSNGKSIGWKAEEGNPINLFMRSGSISKVEDIRQDTEAGVYYKYGYFKGAEGWVMQIGVLAEKINEFLDSFDMQRMLAEMEADSSIESASFLDTNLTMVAYGTHDHNDLLTPAAQAAIDNDLQIIEPIDHVAVYRVLLPVYIDDQKAGTLVLNYDLTDTMQLVRNNSLIGTAALLLMYLLFLGISIVNYKKNKRLSHYAYHDLVTDLPNKRYLQEMLRADAAGSYWDARALLLVNYRNFKQINMLFGYQYGENVIRDLAVRLHVLDTGGYHLFHLSGDRFVIYVTGYQGREELSMLCLKIMEALKEALPSKTIGGNIGVVEAAYFIDDLEKLLKYAMLAGEHVGVSEPFGYSFYSSEMEAQLTREEDIEKELLAAAKGDAGAGLYLMYQPILHVKTDTIRGLEALARLRSNKLGEVSPAEFIPIAERSQLIVSLGRQIIRDACCFLKALKAAGHDHIVVSVNISAIQIMRDDFVQEVLDIIAQTGVDPNRLGIELTESVFADQMEEINAKLAALKAQGLHIAIDDFGTGYSSLARERDLDISCLKIDKSFIDRLSDLHPDRAITGDIISMAHRLGHEVVAEGVENARQREYLKQNGCDCIQGFLFSRPLMPEDVLALLDAEKRRREAPEITCA